MFHHFEISALCLWNEWIRPQGSAFDHSGIELGFTKKNLIDACWECRARKYTDTGKFTLRCSVCQKGVVGEKVTKSSSYSRLIVLFFLSTFYFSFKLITYLSLIYLHWKIHCAGGSRACEGHPTYQLPRVLLKDRTLYRKKPIFVVSDSNAKFDDVCWLYYCTLHFVCCFRSSKFRGAQKFQKKLNDLFSLLSIHDWIPLFCCIYWFSSFHFHL